MPSIHGMQGGAPKYKLVYNPINYHQRIIYHKPWLHCLDTTFAHHLVAVAKSFPKWSSGYPSGTIPLTVWKRQRWPLVRAGSRKKGRLCRRRRRLGMAWREGGSSGVLAIYWYLSSHIGDFRIKRLRTSTRNAWDYHGLPWITMNYHIHYMVFVCCHLHLLQQRLDGSWYYRGEGINLGCCGMVEDMASKPQIDMWLADLQ